MSQKLELRFSNYFLVVINILHDEANALYLFASLNNKPVLRDIIITNSTLNTKLTLIMFKKTFISFKWKLHY